MHSSCGGLERTTSLTYCAPLADVFINVHGGGGGGMLTYCSLACKLENDSLIVHLSMIPKNLFNYKYILQGRPQDLAGGGANNFFFRFLNLHVASRHAEHGEAMRFARGVRGHGTPRNFFKIVQFGAFWCIF